MGYVIKNTNGRYVSGLTDDDCQFTEDFKCAWWWEAEEDAEYFIDENDVEDVTAEDSGGENPPGPPQPGKP